MYFSLVRKPATRPEAQPQSLKPTNVILYAYEKNGSHIFDGAIIAVIDQGDGQIVTEKIADRDGRVVFVLSPGLYRFQPSPLRENRVVGTAELTIPEPREESYEITLFLTEVGPASFGAPVKSCEDKYSAVEAMLEQANYCTSDDDCKIIEAPGFACRVYIHKGYDTTALFNRIEDYSSSPCILPAVAECAAAVPAVCKLGKCAVISQ